ATLDGRPNQLYEHHYRQLNFALDRLALALTEHIQSLGKKALPIPASQIVDWQNQRGHLSHKRVAVAAGLGWLGRNNLLVTPEFGAQVRLVTVLTDLPPEGDITRFHPGNWERVPSPEQPSACDSCRACIAACPAHAVGETPADFNHLACYEQLKEFQRRRYVSQYICGLCVRACTGTKHQRPDADR
ncbi:MAG: reductive dehalogenase domain-containing protein, partial [candidate division WOR-3 bacterium]